MKKERIRLKIKENDFGNKRFNSGGVRYFRGSQPLARTLVGHIIPSQFRQIAGSQSIVPGRKPELTTAWRSHFAERFRPNSPPTCRPSQLRLILVRVRCQSTGEKSNPRNLPDTVSVQSHALVTRGNKFRAFDSRSSVVFFLSDEGPL